ncbi:MAG: D-2-hydroxyacid dehydrogenase [Caldilinea sp.]
MKLLVTVPWDPEQLQQVKAQFPQVIFCSATTAAAVLAEIVDAEVVFGDFSREAFLAAKELRWVQCHGAGVNKLVAIPELLASSVQITSTKGAHAPTIAEHFFGLLISLARRFPQLQAAQQQKNWVPWTEWSAKIGAHPIALQGRTLGVIGLGKIGRAIAVRAQAFEMKVIAVDLLEMEKPSYVDQLGQLEHLSSLLQSSDVVVVAVPGTPATAHLLDADRLGELRRDAILIVVSRGGIVDETALCALLRDGHLAGAALDVTEQEPPPADSPLWNTPNLLLTPHIAGKSTNTTAAATQIFSENLARYLAQQPLQNLVDKLLGF